MEDIFGKKYELVSSENLDEYLKFLGVNFVNRKIASTLKPSQSLVKNDDGTYTMITITTLFSSNLVFTPGVEVEETKIDGSKTKSTFTLEGNKLIQIQKEGDKVSKHIREFYPDKLIVTTTAEGMKVVVRREYKVVN